MKTLICGNGPSLMRQTQARLEDGPLPVFERIVRVNYWEPLEGYGDQCDAWIMYPHHHLTMSEPAYDLIKQAELTKEIWLAHSWARGDARAVFERYPDYTLTHDQFKSIMLEFSPNVPTTGLFGIYMATLIEPEVWIAGFDFFTEGFMHYYDELPNSLHPFKRLAGVHDMHKDEAWVNERIEKGVIHLL